MATKKKETTSPKKKRAPFDSRTRVQKIKDASREELRKKFQADKYILYLQKAMTDLAEIQKKQGMKKHKDDYYLFTAQKDTIKTIIDLNIKRLKFCLPELKSIELSDPNGESPFTAAMAALVEATKS